MPATSESLIIAAPVAEVWRAVTDLEQARRWNGAWDRVEYLSDQREGVGTTFRAYGEDGLGHNFRISDWAPNEHVAFAPPEDEPEEDRGYLINLRSQAFRLRALSDDATEVTLIASVTTNGLRGWIAGRFVWPSYQRQGLRSALEALRALFEPEDEAGEDEEDGEDGGES
jgi:uncharacterized protein YndB with AHSA1/START domain